MTPATYASRFIQEIEKRYGSRDRSWTFVGVEFHTGQPQVWFPGSHDPPGNTLPSAWVRKHFPTGSARFINWRTNVYTCWPRLFAAMRG